LVALEVQLCELHGRVADKLHKGGAGNGERIAAGAIEQLEFVLAHSARSEVRHMEHRQRALLGRARGGARGSAEGEGVAEVVGIVSVGVSVAVDSVDRGVALLVAAVAPRGLHQIEQAEVLQQVGDVGGAGRMVAVKKRSSVAWGLGRREEHQAGQQVERLTCLTAALAIATGAVVGRGGAATVVVKHR